MLVLSRKVNETINIGEDIRITLTLIRGQHVRIAIEAPKDMPILRAELVQVPGPTPAKAAPLQRSSRRSTVITRHRRGKHPEKAMRHNPISRLFSLFRPVQLRRPDGDCATGRCRPDDFPRLDELLKVNSVSRTTAIPAALGEPSSIIPPESSASSLGGDARWSVSTFASRKEARRLRVLDRAIAEIARDRRPR